MMWRESAVLAIDIETTGLDPEADRVVELAGCVFQGSDLVSRRGTLINPGVDIPAEASAVHGIGNADVAGAPKLAQVAPRFLVHVRQADAIVAFNSRFDLPFLDASCPGFAEARSGKPVLDPFPVAKAIAKRNGWPLGGGRMKLTALCERFGIPMRGDAHRATTDAIAAVELLHVVGPMWGLSDGLEAASGEVAALVEQDQRDFEAYLERKRTAELRRAWESSGAADAAFRAWCAMREDKGPSVGPGHVQGSDTSKAAADSLSDGTAKALREIVYRHLLERDARGATDDEMEAALGMRHQTLSARRRELVIKGLAIDSGDKRKTRSGRSATVWFAVPRE